MIINIRKSHVLLLFLICIVLLQGCQPLIVTTEDAWNPNFDIKETPSFWPASRYLPRNNVEQLESNYYYVTSAGFEDVVAEQEREDYCWAAAVQMVLRYHNGGRSTPSQKNR